MHGGKIHDSEGKLSSLIRCLASGSAYRINRVNVN